MGIFKEKRTAKFTGKKKTKKDVFGNIVVYDSWECVINRNPKPMGEKTKNE